MSLLIQSDTTLHENIKQNKLEVYCLCLSECVINPHLMPWMNHIFTQTRACRYLKNLMITTLFNNLDELFNAAVLYSQGLITTF